MKPEFAILLFLSIRQKTVLGIVANIERVVCQFRRNLQKYEIRLSGTLRSRLCNSARQSVTFVPIQTHRVRLNLLLQYNDLLFPRTTVSPPPLFPVYSLIHISGP